MVFLLSSYFLAKSYISDYGITDLGFNDYLLVGLIIVSGTFLHLSSIIFIHSFVGKVETTLAVFDPRYFLVPKAVSGPNESFNPSLVIILVWE